MPKYIGESGFRHNAPRRVGLLVTNLGSPDDPSTSAVRRYLAEFLMDPRVVEVPRLIWRVILHGVILRFRPSRSARAYQKVWEEDGSPLISISKAQCAGIAKRMQEKFGDDVVVDLAMRYGNPSITDTLSTLNEKNVRHLLVLPLYPQYSAVTSASTFDAIANVFTRKRWLPELRMINQYHDQPGYIHALADSVRTHWHKHGRGQKLLMSFHGIPQRYLVNGDPYHCQSHKTARLLADALHLKEDDWAISFQSRLGREEWLRPYTSDIVEQWAGEGLKNIDAICPGFSADCLETLEEMVMEYGDLFTEKGGDALNYIPCLNADSAHLDFLTELAVSHMQPWLQQADQRSDSEALEAQSQRAKTLGAQD